MVRSIAILILFLVTSACNRQVCTSSRSIETVKLLQANFDSAAEISFCKGGRQPHQVNITVNQPGALKISETYIRYRTASSKDVCSESANAQELVPVALTSKSFAEFKLCYQDSSKTAILILNLKEACPSGTIEQTSAVDDCKIL